MVGEGTISIEEEINWSECRTCCNKGSICVHLLSVSYVNEALQHSKLGTAGSLFPRVQLYQRHVSIM